jgi:DNA-binding Lrp family transcriptional regulator
MLAEIEKRVSKLIQQDISLEKRPFKTIAGQAFVSEEEVLATIQGLMENGSIRKFGAILRHQKAGFVHNAMVIWAVPPEKCESAGYSLASFAEVTHCYERVPPFEGKYNIFTMIHFQEENQESIIQKLSQAAAIKDFKVLASEEEYKKNSMEYFIDVA